MTACVFCYQLTALEAFRLWNALNPSEGYERAGIPLYLLVHVQSVS